MLSVILYGRNDSHGYNLHKRGALSLNAIAEVLTGDSDEIIFVDYNTPDELPTFPEAIADTLTDRCKQKLRILRVRSSYHAQFIGQTRLVALECQSRNIAIRRSNPANRWVLSTNTDMIFCPKDGGAGLTRVLEGLEDGFYHLPRFEVPEGFWERLSRTDPQGAVAAMHEAGVRFHLNEVVFGSYDNLYEGPGDFQLFLRQDLFDIAGFDERMILGWHADTNIARRMRLLRGEVRTAFDRVAGYHCGHTRQATSLHGGGRTENSLDTFVHNVTDPVAGHQRDTWGAPELAVEEIRLTVPEVYLEAMAAAVPQGGPAYSEATYNESNFNVVVYDTDHVLPHLCDVLFNLAGDQKIFFFGDDIRLLDGVRNFLETAGKAPKFLLTDLAAAPNLDALDADRWRDCARPFAQGVAEASLFVVQYPQGDALPLAARQALEWWCQRVLSSIADIERFRPAHLRRRIVVVNGLHNGLFNLVESTLKPSVMPFSSRLRQGFVVDDRLTGHLEGAPEWPIYERLGRTYAFLPEDWNLLDRLISGFRSGKPTPGWERLAPELAALTAAPAVLREARGISEDEAERWGGLADAAMRHNLARLAAAPQAVSPRPEVANRLLSGADWDSPGWARLAQTYFGAGVMAFQERKRWVWERVSLALEVQKHLPVDLTHDEVGADGPRILFLADSPDVLALILVHLGYRVSFVSSPALVGGEPDIDWRDVLDLSWLSMPPNLKPLEPTDRDFDGVVVSKPSLFEKPRNEVEAILEALHPRMGAGSFMLAASTVQMNENAFDGGFGFAEWKVLYEPQGPLGARGFRPVGGLDLTIPLDTVARFAMEDDPQETVYGLSYGLVNTFNTSVLLTALWPDVLRPGPETRLAWTDGLIDANEVAIPYGAVSLGDGLVSAYRAGGAGDLAARAFEAIERPAVAIGSRQKNILPFAVMGKASRRSPVGLSLSAEDGVGPWLAVCLNAGDARQLWIELEGAVIEEGSALIHGLGSGRVRIKGGRAALDRDKALGRVSIALRFQGDQVDLTRIIAWAEN